MATTSCFILLNTTSALAWQRVSWNKFFMLFAQANVPIARKYGSAGLGLAICWRLVQLMGGPFHVESREGAGRAFLRLLTFSVVDLAQCVQAQPDSPPTAWDGLALSIFLVEDNDINIRCARAMLGKLGHQLTVAEQAPQRMKGCQCTRKIWR